MAEPDRRLCARRRRGGIRVLGARRAPRGVRFVRRHRGTVVTLYLLTGALFVALLVVYGAIEIYGGSRVGGWRGVAVGQAYIVARLAIRLTFGASEVRLFRALAADDARQPASPPVDNPGPPAAR